MGSNSIKYTFSGHESFPCKTLWLKKGYDLLAKGILFPARNANSLTKQSMVSNTGTNVRTRTYILPEKDKKRVSELEQKINPLLSGIDNVDICTLLEILNKKMKR